MTIHLRWLGMGVLHFVSCRTYGEPSGPVRAVCHARAADATESGLGHPAGTQNAVTVRRKTVAVALNGNEWAQTL
jgi:hypothetical protein